MFRLDISKRILKSVRKLFKLHYKYRITYLLLSFPTAKIMRHWTRFWRISTIFLDTQVVEPNQRYQNSMNRDENSFILLQMSQNYIYKRLQIHLTNFEVISRVQTPYWIVKIDPFLADFRKLAEVVHTSPLGSRIYLEGFSDPINSFKQFPGRFEQFFKKSIFWSRTCPDSDRRGSHHFPKAVFPNIQARYLKTVFNIRQIKV